MLGLYIALIAVAGVIAVFALAVLLGALISTHVVLGHRSEYSDWPQFPGTEKYAVDYKWFDDVKPQCDSFTITAYDGIRLAALRIKHHDGNDKVAVCCHGYGATYRAVQRQAKLFYDRGFDVLLPSMRGHGNSGGKIGMAWTDRFDVARWVDMLIGQYGKSVQIALFGISMGGATVVAVAGSNPPKQVKCVIDDCGFSSQSEEYMHEINKYPCKSFVKFVFFSGVRLVHGYAPAEADIVPFAQKMSVPALFVHGKSDRVVPVELGQKLFDACGSKDKTFLAVDDADHTFSCAVDEAAYTAALDKLIDKYFYGADPRPEKPAVEELAEENNAKPVEENPETPADGSETPADGLAD